MPSPKPKIPFISLADPNSLSLVEELIGEGLSVRIQVTGVSMCPFLQGWEFLTLCRLEPKNLAVGDLILFVTLENRPLVHRIIRITKNIDSTSILTKGDGLSGPDVPIDFCRVLARVTSIERKTTVNGACNTGGLIKLDSMWQRMTALQLAKRGLWQYYVKRLLKLLKRS